MDSVIYGRAVPIPVRQGGRTADPAPLEQQWGFHGTDVPLWQAVLGTAVMIGAAVLAGFL